MPIATLHLTNAYHDSSGGIRTLYHALLDEAERQERQMTLVVPGAEDRYEWRGRHTRIIHLRAPRSPIVDRRYRIILPHRFALAGHTRLWQILRSTNPDVVEICDKYSLCYLAGIIRRRRRRESGGPTLVGLSCERMDDNLHAFGRGSGLSRRAARTFLGRAYIGMFDVHVANSTYTAQELNDAMRPPHLRPIYVRTMGVQLPPAQTALTRAAHRRRLLERLNLGNVDLVLYAGRLSPEKHVDVLPEMLAAASDGPRPVHLLIAGDGPLRRRLESDAAVIAPGRVHFLGHVSDRGELWRLLAGCDVFVHPNPREPFGIGPLEAMAAGAPVVLPEAGGVLSYATHDNAWLASPRPRDLGRAVRACLDRPAERDRRAAGGRTTAEAHAWPAAASRIFALYESVHARRLAYEAGVLTPTSGVVDHRVPSCTGSLSPAPSVTRAGATRLGPG